MKLLIVVALLLCGGVSAGTPPLLGRGDKGDEAPKTWQQAYARRMEHADWRHNVCDSLLKYQLPNGGWPKNEDWLTGQPHSGQHATIDNGATWKELRFLALCGEHVQEVERGLRLLLSQQYDNGGFPQFLPPKADYSRHITFNDNAMVGALRLLRDFANGALYCSDSLREECERAVSKGIDCILRCQIIDPQTGRPAVWCQQHDEQTLLPAPARAYELASFSAGSETADILRFLMELPQPNEQVKKAVSEAMNWLTEHALHDKAYVRVTDSLGQGDRVLIDSVGAPLIWARFYDLENARPLFSDRDGLPRTDLMQVSYERRNGYAWFSTEPGELLPIYKEWEARQ